MEVKFSRDDIMTDPVDPSEKPKKIERVLVQFMIDRDHQPVRVAMDDDFTRYAVEYQAFLDSEKPAKKST